MRKIFTTSVVVLSTLILSSCGQVKESGETWGSLTIDESEAKKIDSFLASNEVQIKIGSSQKAFPKNSELDEFLRFESEGLVFEMKTRDFLRQVFSPTGCRRIDGFEMKSNGIRRNPKTIDAVLDLSYFWGSGKGEGEAELNTVSEDRAYALRTQLEEVVRPGDVLNLRFIGTVDYGPKGKNMPYTDGISIRLQDPEGMKMLSIDKLRCWHNKRKSQIYVQVKSADYDISIPSQDSGDSADSGSEKPIKLAWKKNSKRVAQDSDQMFDMIEKEFDKLYQSGRYGRGSFIIELLHQTDLLDSKRSSTETYFFTDGEFQLHPNFKMNYRNPGWWNLEKMGDFSSDNFNRKPEEFKRFYQAVLQDGYFDSVKKKCANAKKVVFIWSKSRTNQFFEEYLKTTYRQLLPNCTITFN